MLRSEYRLGTFVISQVIHTSITLLNLSSWCLVMVEGLFLAVPWGCLQFMTVVSPDHTHLLFLQRQPTAL